MGDTVWPAEPSADGGRDRRTWSGGKLCHRRQSVVASVRHVRDTDSDSPFSYDGLLYVNGGKGKALFAIKPGAVGDLTAGEDGKLSEFVAWSQLRGGTYLPTEVA